MDVTGEPGGAPCGRQLSKTSCGAPPATGQPRTLRRQAGHGHVVYFIASLVDDHLQHHTRVLSGRP